MCDIRLLRWAGLAVCTWFVSVGVACAALSFCVVHVTAGTFCLSSDVALSLAAFQQWLREVCEVKRPACVVLACPNTVAVGEAVVGVVAPWVIAFGGCRPADVDHFVRCGWQRRLSCMCDFGVFSWLA